MEFKPTVGPLLTSVRLQFYRDPPSDTIELTELESHAIDRMRVLKAVETVKQDYLFGSKEYEERMTTELSKLGQFGKLLTLTTSATKNIKVDIRLDVISHFILQVIAVNRPFNWPWFMQMGVV